MFRPEIFAATLGCAAAARSCGRPAAHLAGPERRLAEMVDHDRRARGSSRELGHVAEVAREDAGKLEDQPPLLEEGEALEHRGPGGSSAGRARRGSGAGSPAASAAQELVEPLARPLGREQVDPGDHAADPGVLARVLEHGVGVEVGSRPPARAPSSRLPAPLEQRLEVGRARTCAGSRRARPSSRAAASRVEVPEVVVGVDDHRGRGSEASDVRACAAAEAPVAIGGACRVPA